MRAEGFYWVRTKSQWTIAFWYSDYWGEVLTWNPGYYTDADFEEIDETPIKRPLTAEQLKEQDEALLKAAKYIQDHENQ